MRRASQANYDDMLQYRKLFNYIDDDRSNAISPSEISNKMAVMLGQFTWEDDGDGQMNFDEFVECMTKINPNTRASALMFARQVLKGDGYANAKKVGSSSSTRKSTPTFSTDDMNEFRKLFTYFDSDRSGQLQMRELINQMAPLVGEFSWNDDGDGEMSYEEFVTCMEQLDPPARSLALYYSRTYL
jgi:Ca2+-binding EF-hand superfamily protein